MKWGERVLKFTDYRWVCTVIAMHNYMVYLQQRSRRSHDMPDNDSHRSCRHEKAAAASYIWWLSFAKTS